MWFLNESKFNVHKWAITVLYSPQFCVRGEGHSFAAYIRILFKEHYNKCRISLQKLKEKKKRKNNYWQGSVQSTKAIIFNLPSIPGKKTDRKVIERKETSVKPCNSLAFVPLNLHTCMLITQRNPSKTENHQIIKEMEKLHTVISSPPSP